MLAQVLQQDLGVHYNPDAVGDFSFAEPTTAFIHGMIPAPSQTTADTPGGTCATMPVLYIAVGRRLGYPLRLVTTNTHLFARWDGQDHHNPAWRETFNCETTNGFHKRDDTYYKNWPHPLTDEQVEYGGYLESLTPLGELTQFVATRGHHGEDHHQVHFASRCYEIAHLLDPARPCYRRWMRRAGLRTSYEPEDPWLKQYLKDERAIEVALNPKRGGAMPFSPHQDLPAHLQGPTAQPNKPFIPGVPPMPTPRPYNPQSPRF
ncbi:MAG: hypothetical protein AAGI37_11950 [Planctomycetota bacterium]